MTDLNALLLRADHGITSGQPTMSGKQIDELLGELAACRCKQGVCVLDCSTCSKAIVGYRDFIHRLAFADVRSSNYATLRQAADGDLL